MLLAGCFAPLGTKHGGKSVAFIGIGYLRHHYAAGEWFSLGVDLCTAHNPYLLVGCCLGA